MEKNFSITKLLINNPVVIEGIDGKVYTGRNLKATVNAMRRASWGMPARNLNGYMRQVAKRVYDWNKIVIRTTSIRIFVEDLARAGVIKVHQRS